MNLANMDNIIVEQMAKEETKTMDNSEAGCNGNKSGHVMLFSTKELLRKKDRKNFIWP